MAKKRKIVLNIVIGLMIVGGLISYKIYSSINLSNTSFEEDQVELFIPTGADEKDLEAMISPYL